MLSVREKIKQGQVVVNNRICRHSAVLIGNEPDAR